MPEKKIYTLSSVTKAIEILIKDHCNKSIWVKAEIVKLNYYKQTGHCYPDLIEKKENKIIAELRGNIWKSNFEQINHKFKSVLNDQLGDNMSIVCLAIVRFHSVYGLSLDILDIDPSYTLGELARKKAETIKKLKEENLFSLNKQKKLPLLPKTIAILSADTSKGYNDLINILDKNSWNYKFHYKLFQVILQGDRAVKTIIHQLNNIKKYHYVFDAVAIVRGGGDETGLSCFDEYILAKEIGAFPIPILSGIGHSTNETVVEMVCYGSFITPTKLGEFLIQNFHNVSVPLKDSIKIINNYTNVILEKNTTKIRETARLFNSLTRRILDDQQNKIIRVNDYINGFIFHIFNEEKHSLKNIANKVQTITTGFLQYFHRQIFETISKTKYVNEKIIQDERNKFISNQKLLFILFNQALDNAKNNIESSEEKIKLLSPFNILKRGFSITKHRGKVILNTSDLNMGDVIETELFEGKINSKIEIINKKNNLFKWLKK